MKSLHHIFDQNRKKNKQIDEKTIFHVFSQIILQEYGVRGQRGIIPSFYKEKILFIHFTQSLWAQEVWMNRAHIIKQLNDRIGSVVVHKIVTK